MDLNQTQPCSRRTRRAAATLLFVSLVGATASRLAHADSVVHQLSGKVEIGRGEPPVWSPLTVGAAVQADDRIRTGEDGRVELGVDAGTLRVHENSLLKLPPADASVDRVELERGHSLFDVLRREGRQFEVRTPTVVVSVKGTRFGVESSAEAGIVSVYRGVVGVRASEASELVETLVREGFLATGGRNLPLELEIAPAGDVWSTWQDFKTGARQGPASESPKTELDRARTSLRRATDGEVVQRAAERNPEIAERLRQHKGDANSSTGSADEEREKPPVSRDLPASPANLDSTESNETIERESRDDARSTPLGRDETRLDPSDTQRSVLDSKHGGDALQALPESIGLNLESITDGSTFPNGDQAPAFSRLEGYEASEIILLRGAMMEMRDASTASAQAWTPSDVTTYLQNDLISQGMDAEDAANMIQQLFGR